MHQQLQLGRAFCTQMVTLLSSSLEKKMSMPISKTFFDAVIIIIIIMSLSIRIMMCFKYGKLQKHGVKPCYLHF